MKKVLIPLLALCAFGSAHAFNFDAWKTRVIQLTFPTAPAFVLPTTPTAPAAPAGSCTASAGGSSSAATGGSSATASSSSSTSPTGVCTTTVGLQLRP